MTGRYRPQGPTIPNAPPIEAVDVAAAGPAIGQATDSAPVSGRVCLMLARSCDARHPGQPTEGHAHPVGPQFLLTIDAAAQLRAMLDQALEHIDELVALAERDGTAAVIAYADQLDLDGLGAAGALVTGLDGQRQTFEYATDPEAAYNLGVLRREGRCPGCGRRIFDDVAARGGCHACYPDLPDGEAVPVGEVEP